MYRWISIISFLFIFGGIGLSCLLWPCKECRRNPLKMLVRLFTLIFIEQKLSPAEALRKLVYLLALLCFVILAITGFYPTLVLGEHISGYLLMIHATFAPILAVCLAILAVMWAANCRFAANDWPWLRRIIQRVTLAKNVDNEGTKSQICIGQRISFWLIIFLALPLILSIVMSMFPYFGTYWQKLLLSIHRYTALVFVLVVIVHTYLLIRTQIE
ncbi:MAG: hypothetical protein JW715_14945 [Sedimentisphaerales bacterium]|nr:hypothetical protein [Sedimentisphaerales bacterium]